MKNIKSILECGIVDLACGGRMFYRNKQDERVLFCDKREYDGYLCDGRHFIVKPDLLSDFTAIPIPDNTANCFVLDPPHLLGESSGWQKIKYGWLDTKNWRETLTKGFAESFRALRVGGILLFKWNTTNIPLKEVIALTKEKYVCDLLGGKNGKTYLLAYVKGSAK